MEQSLAAQKPRDHRMQAGGNPWTALLGLGHGHCQVLGATRASQVTFSSVNFIDRELCIEGEGEIPWKPMRVVSNAFKAVNPTNEVLWKRNPLPVVWGRFHLMPMESQHGLGSEEHRDH